MRGCTIHVSQTSTTHCIMKPRVPLKPNRWLTRSAIFNSLVSAAVLSTVSPALAQKVWSENFESLPLGPKIDEGRPGEKVWTNLPPEGWLWDNSAVPGVGTALDGVTEWAGWGFADKNWWVLTAGDQRRSEWSFGQGTVMIADPDEWDDAAHPQGLYKVDATTPPITIQGQAPNSLVLAFDSSWRPEAVDDGEPSFPVGPEGEKINNQTGTIAIAFDSGALTEILRWDSLSDSPTYKADSEFINEAVMLPLNNPGGVTTLRLKFGMEQAANDWWWAVDNLAIGVPPFVTGISADGVSFTVRIGEAPGKAVDESKGITLELDGQNVTPSAVTREDTRVLVKYSQAPEIFPPSTRHTVKVKFSTNDGRQVEDSVEFVAPSYTTVSATPATVTATITDQEWLTVDESKGVQLELDGTMVTAGPVSRADASVVVSYSQAPTLFAPNSKHTLKVTFTTATGKLVADPLEFTAPNYVTLPVSLGTDLGTGGERGMRWRTHQIETNRGTTIKLAEDQLTGLLGASIHDASAQGTDGYFAVPFVNFDQGQADAGNFNISAAPPQDVFDDLIPGIPGLLGDGTESTDNIAAESLAFLEFTQTGLYTMVVNSDDGFQVSAGTTNQPNRFVLGAYDAGRGQADSIFYFKIDKAGVYFFRLLYFEGGSDARVEWFTVNTDGSRALVNGTQNGAIKAYRKRTVAEPEVTAGGIESIALNGGKAIIAYTGTLKSADTVTGPFSAVPAATSPYSADPAGAQKFYLAE